MTEYLVLADGTKIDPQTRKPVKEAQEERYYRVPSHSEAVRQVASVRRRVADLPLPPKQMNTVSLVVFYSLFGMTPDDIAIALGISESQVLSLMEREEFGRVKEDLLGNIAEQDKSDVRSMFSTASKSAVRRLIEIAEDDETDDKNALVAINSILDRAGLRPADVVEHRHKVEGGLAIEYIKTDPSQSMPTIDITPEDDADRD